jgi:hypothetical protein
MLSCQRLDKSHLYAHLKIPTLALENSRNSSARPTRSETPTCRSDCNGDTDTRFLTKRKT